MVEGVICCERCTVTFHFDIGKNIEMMQRNKNGRLSYSLSIVSFCLLLVSSAISQTRSVDFGYSPSQYFTAICFPEDWRKTLVNEKGALLYDFGPGPYARPLTEILIGGKGKDLQVTRQTLEDARVPMVSTVMSGGGIAVRQHAFSILPTSTGVSLTIKGGSVRRIGGLNGCIDWASPSSSVDPAFRNVAWGTNRPILYRVKVEAGSRKRVAMGLCESYKSRPGSRLIELRVEGANSVTMDPLPDGKKNEPHVAIQDGQDSDRDGWLRVEAHASSRSPDPNVILNAFWVFADSVQVSSDKIIRGELSRFAEVYHACGTEMEDNAPSPRMDAIVATFEGAEYTPVVIIRTRRSLMFDVATGVVSHRGKPFVLSRPKPLAMIASAGMYSLEMPGGTKQVELVVVNGLAASAASIVFPDLDHERNRARDFWHTTKAIPARPLVVPDSGIQFLLDAGLRNMYQIADVVDGRFQFQPGPTVYRGLWLADVVFTGETALMLGDTLSVRRFIEGALGNQLPSGQVRVMYPTQSLTETPAYLHALCRYAQWTGNKAWLRKHWFVVQKGIQWLRAMRDQTPPGTPYAGLMPPGFIDGGISTEHADYGATLWAMVALEKGIAAARWLGEPDDAREWQILFEQFMHSLKNAARRDLRNNNYLPIIVGDTSHEAPQRGQYAFLLPLCFSSLFQSHDGLMDSIIHSNLAMLDTRVKEGLIANSGWMKDGVWPWLGGVHGMVHHLVGNNQKAVDILYAVANHASPTGVWVEEQQQQKDGTNTSGDASNAEASAIFIHFVRNLLVREKLDTLEFLSGVPDEWIHPGALLEVNNGLTGFGPVNFSARISDDGKSGEIHVSAINGRGTAGRPVVVLAALKRAGFVAADGTPLPERLLGTWRQPIRLSIRSSLTP